MSEDLFGTPHPESENLLALIGTPELLETYDTAEIRKFFERAGYEHIESALVTVGWGRKISDEETNTPTNASLLTKDGKLIKISLGASGTFSIDVIVHDVESPSVSEQKFVRDYYSAMPQNHTEKYRKAIEKLLELPVIETEKTGFVAKIRKLFGR